MMTHDQISAARKIIADENASQRAIAPRHFGPLSEAFRRTAAENTAIEFAKAARTGWPEALTALEEARKELDDSAIAFRELFAAHRTTAKGLEDVYAFLRELDAMLARGELATAVQLKIRNALEALGC